eukprot:Rmarinus@m.12083
MFLRKGSPSPKQADRQQSFRSDDLVAALRSNNDPESQKNALRVLSTWTASGHAVDKFIHLGGVELIIGCVMCNDPELRGRACVVLANMSTDEVTANLLGKQGAVEALLGAVKETSVPGVQAQAMRALSNFANCKALISTIINGNGVLSAVMGLRSTHPPVRLHSSALLANLSAVAESHKPIMDLGGHRGCLELLSVEPDQKTKWLLLLVITNILHTDSVRKTLMKMNVEDTLAYFMRDEVKEIRMQATQGMDVVKKGKASKMVDSYGFESTISMASFGRQEQKQDRALQTRRENKWMKMLSEKRWPDYHKGKKQGKLAKRVRKGIPDKMRPRAWRMLLDVHATQSEKTRYRSYLEQECKFLEIIQRDVNRALSRNECFSRTDTTGDLGKDLTLQQQALTNILIAYSVSDPEVGYCQGMSVIAAILLLYMTEEEAFLVFSAIMRDEKHNFRQIFLPGFPLLYEYLYIFQRLAEVHVPAEISHIQKEGCDPIMYAEKWFMTLLQYAFPFPILLRGWDVYFCEGPHILFRMALAVLKTFSAKILSLSFEKLIVFLQREFTEALKDPDVFLDTACSFKIPSATFQKLHKEYEAR